MSAFWQLNFKALLANQQPFVAVSFGPNAVVDPVEIGAR